MKNKEKALDLVERVESSISNLKSTVYRGYSPGKGLDDRFDQLNNLVEQLKDLISIQDEEFLNRPYRGL